MLPGLLEAVCVGTERKEDSILFVIQLVLLLEKMPRNGVWETRQNWEGGFPEQRETKSDKQKDSYQISRSSSQSQCQTSGMKDKTRLSVTKFSRKSING